MNNIFVLNKNYKKIGTLSNQGANPQAPYYNDLYVQELDTGADTYQFSTVSNAYTQDCIEIGNHIMFAYKNRNELFTITSIEYSHSEGYKTIGVYAEGIGFELLEIYMKKPDDTSSDDEGGRDEDNDGDTSTDDEYADLDDMYLDENGIIIYDKDGSGPPKEEDMYVDENGIIVYKRSKNNRKNDSLEFKNISYPTFLNVLLKNTGWSFVCQPGLESIKHDITVRYDTNIYAILQDSMQSYKGVELEFVFEYNNGKVQKTIKAYKDGGRGSFVGKRFEYGTNIKGITKTQKVANNEDDTVLYVDDVGIEVYYDVDFALKSAEVPEIEIGDTHYVIDTDFHPPMNIKARIGKIEVSFTDPTKNKIYLANNKKISGSAIEEGINEDDIKDIMDDYDGDIGEHTHSYLEHYIYQVHLNGKEFTGANRFYNLGSETFPWWYIFTRAMRAYSDITSPRYFGYNYQVFFDREDMEDVVKITNSSNVTKQDLLNFIVNDLNVYEYSAREVNESVNEDIDDPNARFPNQLYFGLLSEDVVNHGNPCKTSAVGKRISKGLVRSDTNNDGDWDADDTHNAHTYNIPALLAALIGAFQYYVSGGKPTGSNPKDEDYDYTGNPSAPSDPDDPGTGGGTPSNPGSGSYGKIICNELEVSGANGSAGIANVFGELYVTEKIKCELLIEANTLDVSVIEGYQAAFNFLRVGDELDCDYMKCDYMECDCIKFPDGSKLTTANINGDGSGDDTTPSTGNTFDTITVRKIIGPDPGEGQYNRVEFEDGIRVNHIWSADEDGVIHMQDDLALHNSFEVFGDISTDGMVYVNEGIHFADGSVLTSANGSGGGTLSGVPIEYIEQENSSMYLGTSWVQVNNDINVDGSIVMTGSLVGASALENIEFISFADGTVLSSGNSISTLSELSEYATVEALQEEIRIKDEQIANLEARLATIEAMLGINNDN